MRLIFLIIILNSTINSTAEVRDTIPNVGWWFGVEVNKSLTLFTLQNKFSDVFYQDVPQSVKTEYVEENKCCWVKRTKTDVWKNMNKQTGRVEDGNRKNVIYNFNLNYNTKRYTHTLTFGYLNENSLIYRGQVGNEDIRNFVYGLNPNFKLYYTLPSPQSHSHMQTYFGIMPPVYLARYDTQILDFQYFFSRNKLSKKKITFMFMPGVEYATLIKEKSYYSFIGALLDSSYSGEYFSITQRKKYFKPYSFRALLKNSVDIKLSEKMFLSGNVLLQFPPFWQNKNTMELVRTSRIGVGASLNYYLSRKKCKVCPTE